MQCITYTFSCQTLTPVQAGKVTQLRLNAVNPIFKWKFIKNFKSLSWIAMHYAAPGKLQ